MHCLSTDWWHSPDRILPHAAVRQSAETESARQLFVSNLHLQLVVDMISNRYESTSRRECENLQVLLDVRCDIAIRE